MIRKMEERIAILGAIVIASLFITQYNLSYIAILYGG